MEKLSATNRRSFLKSSALVAVPIAAAAPAAALAADDSRAKLARLEDERSIEALQRKFLRYLNGAADCAEFIASPESIDLGQDVRSIAEDLGHEISLEFAENGLSAKARCACTLEREAEFTGHSTLEQMARFQGQGSHRHEERQVLVTEFIKGNDGWRIASARLA
ncbi:hypothetical protein KK137_07735 [Croceibacterium sp. LX-88]|uniref:SnoaL-like domain-containing protein n=1 Tax=Croceibacterium selenioxidans TaxID=2838833 RepID=A0ABS5W548_9SPHN|nr:hypothetical protein [Croceibacterium selenioxidans]MBT2134217.1 hypothetical protein [Croceibacterium selenioxidans]